MSIQAKGGEYPYRTTSCPRGNFSSGNLTKSLSHWRIPEQGPMRASCMPPKLQHFPRLGSPLSWGELLPGCTTFSIYPTSPSLGSHQLLWDWLLYCTGCLVAPTSASLDLGLCNSYHHLIGYLEWGGKSPFSFRAREGSVYHFSSNNFVQTLSK